MFASDAVMVHQGSVRFPDDLIGYENLASLIFNQGAEPIYTTLKITLRFPGDESYQD